MYSFKEKSKKWLFIIAGLISMCIGILGIFLPLVPTTPLLLLSAFLFVKSSSKLYTFLVGNKILGFYIKSYIEKKGIPLKLKILNLTLLWLAIGYTSLCVIDNLYIKIILGIIALSVSLHIILLKTLKR